MDKLLWILPSCQKDHYHRKQLLGLVSGRDADNITDPYLVKAIRKYDLRHTGRIYLYRSEHDIKKRYGALRHGTVGGEALKGFELVTNQYQWVANGTSTNGST